MKLYLACSIPDQTNIVSCEVDNHIGHFIGFKSTMKLSCTVHIESELGTLYVEIHRL